jgi:hypothetical protein
MEYAGQYSWKQKWRASTGACKQNGLTLRLSFLSASSYEQWDIENSLHRLKHVVLSVGLSAEWCEENVFLAFLAILRGQIILMRLMKSYAALAPTSIL